MFPTIHAISAQWAPPNERGRLVGFIWGGKLILKFARLLFYTFLNPLPTSKTGIPFGTMITLAGSGLLASNPHLGWPSVFYISGASGLIWSFFWAWFGSSSPSAHSNISSQEYNFITSQLPPEKSQVSTIYFI